MASGFIEIRDAKIRYETIEKVAWGFPLDPLCPLYFDLLKLNLVRWFDLLYPSFCYSSPTAAQQPRGYLIDFNPACG